MIFSPDKRYRRGGFYRCRVRNRERCSEYFGNLTGLAYEKRKLDMRRANALLRRRRRLPLEG